MQLNVDAGVIERLIFRGVLKLYDPRVTERSLRKFCARYGALIKTDFLDKETRDWLAGSMDLAPGAGKELQAQQGVSSTKLFEDFALLRVFEHAGAGILPVPPTLEKQFHNQDKVIRLGIARNVYGRFYAISAERNLRHPGLRCDPFAGVPRPADTRLQHFGYCVPVCVSARTSVRKFRV